MASTIIADIQKEISYNRANRDYDISIIIDGGKPQYIGCAARVGRPKSLPTNMPTTT